MPVRGLSANKGRIITIGAQGRFYGEQMLDNILAWTSNLSHVQCVMSVQRNGHNFIVLLGEQNF
jgi:hypothetical protein